MNKRPKEIEEAMDCIDNCTLDFSNNAIEAWNTVYEYIKQLENTIQSMMAEEERKWDDGK